MAPRMWSLVLAGGRGRRLAALTRGIPKQYYAPRGDLTLLEDTLDRLAPIAGAARTVTGDRSSPPGHGGDTQVATRVLARAADASLGRPHTAAGEIPHNGLNAMPAVIRTLFVIWKVWRAR